MKLSKKYNLHGGGRVQAKPCIVGGGGGEILGNFREKHNVETAYLQV